MTRAGRTAAKHVATTRRDRSATPEVAPRHKTDRRRHVPAVAASAVLALSLAGTVAARETIDDPAEVTEPTSSAVAPLDFSLRTAQLSRATSRATSRAVSRTAVRPLMTARQVVLEPTAVDHAFATAPLNLRAGPSATSDRVTTVPFASKLALTGQTSDGWAEVLVRREVPASGRGEGRQPARTVTAVRWVNADYLAERKPEPPEPELEETAPEETASTSDETTSSSSATTTSSGLSGSACPDGSTIEAGLTPTADQLYRAACAAFPALTTYGGYAPRGEHADGRAIDFMTSGAAGQALAEFARANAGALGIRNVIYAQRIWTPEQASAGWRWMEDRGSVTANHYDHVHVAVY